MSSPEPTVPPAAAAAAAPQQDQPPSQQQQPEEERGVPERAAAAAEQTGGEDQLEAAQAEVAPAESLRKRDTAVSFGESAAGSGSFSHLNTSDFRRQRTSLMFGVPSQFFMSRQSIRTWGAEEIADPMVQPYDRTDPNLPQPFHVSLPGYKPELCKYVITQTAKPPRDPLLGPDISIFPPVWIPTWKPDPSFEPQPYNFDWKENGSFQMDRFPYHNARFEPHDGSAHHMYNQAYPFTAYPYGVPAV